jgi:hypothetical protein
MFVRRLFIFSSFLQGLVTEPVLSAVDGGAAKSLKVKEEVNNVL